MENNKGAICSFSLPFSCQKASSIIWTFEWRLMDDCSNGVVLKAWSTLSESLGGRWAFSLAISLTYRKLEVTTEDICLINSKLLSEQSPSIFTLEWMSEPMGPVSKHDDLSLLYL